MKRTHYIALVLLLLWLYDDIHNMFRFGCCSPYKRKCCSWTWPYKVGRGVPRLAEWITSALWIKSEEPRTKPSGIQYINNKMIHNGMEWTGYKKSFPQYYSSPHQVFVPHPHLEQMRWSQSTFPSRVRLLFPLFLICSQAKKQQEAKWVQETVLIFHLPT